MISLFGWAALLAVLGYLALFAWGNAKASRAVGWSVWLFGQAKGRDRLAAIGFRGSFAIAALGPMLWLAVPVLHKADPLWTEGAYPVLGLIGVIVAIIGAVTAFAAQLSMGRSWRVGVPTGNTGALVEGGLFRISRNPTFLGQALLLTGVALAVPALPTLFALILFGAAANLQMRSEEAMLARTLGQPYAAYCERVSRWFGFRANLSRSRVGMGLILIAAMLVDQATKAIALGALAQSNPVPVMPGFNFTLGFNEGASFGMLSGAMAGKPWAMVALTGALTLGLWIMALRTDNHWERLGLSLIVGGSLGNIIDRMRQGAVTDFLDVYWRTWHWPTFNLADVFIFLGAMALIAAMVRATPQDVKTDA